MKSYQEFSNLIEQKKQKTDASEAALDAALKNNKNFSKASNKSKTIIRVPQGTGENILSVFDGVLNDAKYFGKTGRGESGSGSYTSVKGTYNGEKIVIFITEKEDSGGGGGSAKAADYEQAICVEYNIITLRQGGKKRRADVLEEAMKIAFQGKKDKRDSYEKKANPLAKVGQESTLTKTGRAVAEGMAGGPKYFVHSGSGLGDEENNYPGGSDKTPKSDIVGSNNGTSFPKDYRYSLKKTGDKSEGAQLMSGKKEESKGIFLASWKSWKRSGRTTQRFKELLEDMEKNLKSNIEITHDTSEIKEKFKKWLFNSNYSSSIIKQVVEKLPQKVFAMNSKKEWIITEKNNLGDKEIQEYLRAIFALAGVLDRTQNIEHNLFHEVVRGSDEKGSVIDVITNKHFTLNIRRGKVGVKTMSLYSLYKLTVAEDEREEVKKVLDAAFSGRVLEKQIEEFITDKKNEDLKQHIVFEAASGWYKFTGKLHPVDESSGKILHLDSGAAAVASAILEFNDSGFGGITKMHTYAKNKSGLVDKIYVAFKGSGNVRYTSVRMPTESVEIKNNLNSIIENSISKHFDSLHEDLIMEGLFGKIKDYASGAWQKTKQVAAGVMQYGKLVLNGIVDFSKRLYEAALGAITKVFSELYAVLSQGFSAFLDFVGLGEPEGDFTISG